MVAIMQMAIALMTALFSPSKDGEKVPAGG